MSRAAFALGGLLYLAACDQWHLSINAAGLVFVSVIGEGSDQRHRFRVRTRGGRGATRILDVPASGQLTLEAAADSPLEITC